LNINSSIFQFKNSSLKTFLIADLDLPTIAHRLQLDGDWSDGQK